MNVQFAGVDLTGAQLEAAWFVGSPPNGATGFDKANCDENTHLPEGWECITGHPKLTGKQEASPSEMAANPFGGLEGGDPAETE